MNVKNPSFNKIIGELKYIPLLTDFTKYFPITLVCFYNKLNIYKRYY